MMDLKDLDLLSDIPFQRYFRSIEISKYIHFAMVRISSLMMIASVLVRPKTISFFVISGISVISMLNPNMPAYMRLRWAVASNMSILMV